MLTFKKGDLFSSGCLTLVNPVNCVGVMGKGLALRFKNLYPQMFADYQRACRKGLLRPGGYSYWKGHGYVHTVLNFATKDHWRDPSRIEWIEEGLADFARTGWKSLGITSIAFPLLGTGCGGLDPDAVRGLMVKYLSDLPVTVEIYVP